MNEKKIGFGIIGCGMISNWHAKAVLEIDGAGLIGATDVNEDARLEFSRKYNTTAYSDVGSMLNDPDVDVVCICTPSFLHAPLAIQAANAKKHIIVEKPMAITKSECDAVIKACDDNGVKMAVISQLRFTDAIRSLKKAVEDKKPGRIVMGDVYMKYYRSQEYYDKGGWRGTWKMDGGGALMNQGIHGIDLLLYIMGPVRSVFGRAKTLVRNIEVEDTASALVEFENGALGVIQGTTSIYPGSSRRLEINGDKGTIIIEEDAIIKWNIEGEEEGLQDIKEKSLMSAASNPAAFGIEGHIMQITDMLEAIKQDRSPLVDQHEGRKPVELILAIYESSRTNMPVKL